MYGNNSTKGRIGELDVYCCKNLSFYMRVIYYLKLSFNKDAYLNPIATIKKSKQEIIIN